MTICVPLTKMVAMSLARIWTMDWEGGLTPPAKPSTAPPSEFVLPPTASATASSGGGFSTAQH